MARVCMAGPEWRSMTSGRTPRRASWLATINPVGPAPTTRISVSISGLLETVTWLTTADRGVISYADDNPGSSRYSKAAWVARWRDRGYAARVWGLWR